MLHPFCIARGDSLLKKANALKVVGKRWMERRKYAAVAFQVLNDIFLFFKIQEFGRVYIADLIGGGGGGRYWGEGRGYEAKYIFL